MDCTLNPDLTVESEAQIIDNLTVRVMKRIPRLFEPLRQRVEEQLMPVCDFKNQRSHSGVGLGNWAQAMSNAARIARTAVQAHVLAPLGRSTMSPSPQ